MSPVSKMVLLIWALVPYLCCCEPEQIHLAATTEPSSVIVTWASPEKCNNSTFVYYSASSDPNIKVEGFCYIFNESNPNGVHFYHQVTLADLTELTRYSYLVSSSGINSSVYSFKTLSSNPSWVPKLLIYGDLGHKGGKLEHELFTVLPSVTKQVQNGSVDLVFHAGDFAYDLDTNGGANGDHFFRMIQPVATSVPYMTCVGNHEDGNNFTQYRHRFAMPRSNINAGFDMWYSFDIGQMHIISWSTEVIFARAQDMQPQYDWIENDLQNANKNRAARPWIVAIGHRPIYCSNVDDDCITKGSAGEHVQQYIEQLFYKYGVDILIWAHEHSYERTWPVFNFNVTQKNYVNPMAPIHLITGAGGCNEDNGLCVNPIRHSKGDWSAFRTEGPFHPYSYGFLFAYNRTHAYWNQINSQLDKVYDEIMIVQDTHAPFPH